MNWTYDINEQALYLTLSVHEVSAQVEMIDGTVVDVDGSGELVGIEILRAWADWDLPALAERFKLDDDTIRSIEFIAGSPLVRSRPLHRPDHPGDVAIVAQESEATSSGPSLQLQPV
jgi:uncharacterized protein YuzE